MTTDIGIISVRIRSNDDGGAAPLTTWPIADLDRLLRELKRWGFSTSDGEYDDVTGQIVVADGQAYFEIVIDTEDMAAAA
jgi:hypothetical protein